MKEKILEKLRIFLLYFPFSPTNNKQKLCLDSIVPKKKSMILSKFLFESNVMKKRILIKTNIKADSKIHASNLI